MLNGADIYFMGNVMVWSDRGYNGMSRAEDMNVIQEINPMLDRRQSKGHFNWLVFTKARADGKIKRRTLKSQATTTERTAIAYQSKWRQYVFSTNIFNDIRKNNMGVCKETGKTFVQLMQHLVLILDEAFIMAYYG